MFTLNKQNKILPSLSALLLLTLLLLVVLLLGKVRQQLKRLLLQQGRKQKSLQDVPVSVSAIREETLEERGIKCFEDYLLQLPGVTAGGSGPGQSTIYIRGLASTTPNLNYSRCCWFST